MQQHSYFAVCNPITAEYIKIEGFFILLHQLHLSFNDHEAGAILGTQLASREVLKGGSG